MATGNAVYTLKIRNRLAGLSGVYVDAILRTGNEELVPLASGTQETFDTKPAVLALLSLTVSQSRKQSRATRYAWRIIATNAT